MQKLKKWFSKLSIQKKILNASIFLLLAAMLIVGITFVFRSVQNTNQALRNTLEKLAYVSADRIRFEFEKYELLAFEIGSIARFTNPDISIESKYDLLYGKVDYYDLVRGHIIMADGVSIFDENLNVSDRDYFKRAMQGESLTTRPTVSRTTGAVSIFVAAPLWENGIAGTNIVGIVLLVLDGNTLNNIVNSIADGISPNTRIYMIDNDGYTIADHNMDSIMANENIEKLAESDRSLRRIASVNADMRRGGIGSRQIISGIKTNIYAYSPLRNNSGLSICIVAPSSDFMAGLYLTIAIVIIMISVISFIGYRFMKIISQNIAEPIHKCVEHLQLIMDGKVHIDRLIIDTEDDTKVLADVTDQLATELSILISDIDYMYNEMGNGNFNASSKNAEIYIEDFAPIIESHAKVNQRLSETINNMKEVSHQVSLGSGQLTQSAQGLAEGATDQSAAVEELQATITDVTEQIKKSADEQKNILNITMEMEKVAEISSTEMESLKKAMRRINETSEKIESIISGIEEIAEQTNLLSLNASIEAARAGEAGRGFAVVANEIRNLAEDSARSAVNTRQLIETAIKEAKNGDEITEKTAESLEKVITGLKSIGENIKEVSEFSVKQAEAMNEIDQGINQISEVVQGNSALAQESSAISQQFSAQAVTLQELIDRFVVARI